MKRGELTEDAVSKAIARIRQAEQDASPSLRPRLRVCLEELIELKQRLHDGDPAAPDRCPDGLAALAFVDHLERSSLGTPGAEALSARTGSRTLHRIARRRRELELDSPPRSDVVEALTGAATRLRSVLRTHLEAWRGPWRRRKPAEAAEASRSGDGWSVNMAGLPEISEVICTVRMRLVVSHTCTQPMSGEFRYRSEDPYAVEAQFRTGGEEKVRWVFARETLIAGLRTTAGAGDVKIWPSRTGGEDVVVIALESPEGNALLEAPREALQTFLRRTSSVVPPGQEWRYIDVDELLHVAAPRAEGRRRSRTDGV